MAPTHGLGRLSGQWLKPPNKASSSSCRSEGTGVALDAATWDLPPVFRWLAAQGGVAPAEMARTFNCGVGMVLIVPAEQADKVVAFLTYKNEKVWRMGEVTATPGVEIAGIDAWQS